MVLEDNSFLYNDIFHIYAAIQRIIMTFSFEIQLTTFSLDYIFLPSIPFDFYFEFPFFITFSNNFFTFKITNKTSPGDGIFSFFSYKKFSDQFVMSFSTKMVLFIDIFTKSPNLHLESFSLSFIPKSIYMIDLTQ